MSFFITRMTELQISNTFALFLLSFASLIGIPLSYLYGWLDDKFDTIKACVVLGIGFVLVCVCLLFGSADHLVLIILAAIGMGSMTGGCPNLHPSSIMTVFGADEYQNANRYIGIGISLISTFGTPLMSSCMDRSGDLNMGYMLFAGLCMIGTLCIATTKKVVTE